MLILSTSTSFLLVARAPKRISKRLVKNNELHCVNGTKASVVVSCFWYFHTVPELQTISCTELWTVQWVRSVLPRQVMMKLDDSCVCLLSRFRSTRANQRNPCQPTRNLCKLWWPCQGYVKLSIRSTANAEIDQRRVACAADC